MNEIIVGNIGSVYFGSDDKRANLTYKAYIDQSKSMRGRAGGEDVTWLQDNEIKEAFVGELNRE